MTYNQFTTLVIYRPLLGHLAKRPNFNYTVTALAPFPPT